jgi:hypothetical protein
MTEPDFESTDMYRRARGMTSWIYALEDRFPDSEIAVLFDRMRGAVVDFGSSLAEGFAREGVRADGALSAAARREARGRLGVVRHLVITAAAQFLLDEHHVKEFDAMYEPLRQALAPAGEP